MARISKTERLARKHSQLLQDFNRAQTGQREVRLECLADRRFYSISGAQWEGSLYQQFINRPKFEFNKIHLGVLKIINEYRNNRIGVSFIPADGSDDFKLTDSINGLYRADEQESVADEAYDNGFEEAAAGGFGAWRLRAVEEDETSDDDYQRIRFEPIFDADSTVFFDRDAIRQDKSDAKKCWVLTPMTYQSYVDTYNDSPTTWPKDVTMQQFDWFIPNDLVYVAETYEVEYIKEINLIFRNAATGEEQEIPDHELKEEPEIADSLAATGWTLARKDKVNCRKVRKYLMSGGKILEDYGYIAGPNIPIVPVFGQRWVVDGIERCMGAVRLVKDAQRLKNMQISNLAMIAAKSGVEKPIFAAEQVQSHAQMWAEDNVRDFPFLLAEPLTDSNGQMVAMGPTSYTKVPNIPPAMAALMQTTEQDMKDLLGTSDAADQINPNGQSGVAVELVQNRIDMNSFIYMSNFAKAMKRSGEIWLGMAKELYIEEGRKMKSVAEDGTISQATIMQPMLGEAGQVEFENDLNKRRLDVITKVGPSSSSRRQSTVRNLIQMMAVVQDPETQQVLASTALLNFEGEGIDDVRKWVRQKLLNMGVLTPTKEEQQILQQQQEAMASQPPDAQTQLMMAAAQESQAKAQKAQADTVLTAAKAEQTKAETAKTMADIGLMDQDKVTRTLENISKAQDLMATGQPMMAEQMGVDHGSGTGAGVSAGESGTE